MTKHQVDISEALARIRDSGEFLNQEQSKDTSKISAFLDQIMEYLSDLKKAVSEWLQGLFPQVDMGSTGLGETLINYLAWGLLIIFVIALFIVLFKLLEHYRKTEKEEIRAIINLDTGTLDSKSWIDLAKNCASNQQYRDACRAVYMSLIFYLDEKGVIKYDSAKTNLEYLQTVRSNKDLYSPLKKIINIFEVLWYGKQKGTPDDYNECIDFYNKVTDE